MRGVYCISILVRFIFLLAVNSRDNEAALTCAGGPLISTAAAAPPQTTTSEPARGCGKAHEFVAPVYTMPTSGKKITISNDLSFPIIAMKDFLNTQGAINPGESKTYSNPNGVWYVIDGDINILPIERNNPINGQECYVIAGDVELEVHVY